MGCISGHQEGERVEEGNGGEGVWRGQNRGGCRGRDGTGREGRKEGRRMCMRKNGRVEGVTL